MTTFPLAWRLLLFARLPTFVDTKGYMAAVHLFLYVKVAPGKNFDLGSNSFNSDKNAAAAAAAAAGTAAAAAAVAASAAGSAACINDVVLGGRFAPP